jgi:hypothetical protein
MGERVDFGGLWPVPPGRFGWRARGNSPCLMEIVCWLTTGSIGDTWRGVPPSIAEYVLAAQDAMDDDSRQKLLVLVPELIGCAEDGDPPGIEAARSHLLAQRSLSLLVPLVLEAGGWLEEAEAVRATGGSFEEIWGPLQEAGEYVRPNPLVAAVIDCALNVVATANHPRACQRSLLPVRAAELAVSVIHCNDAPARRLLLGDRPRMRLIEDLEEVIIKIIKETIGVVKRPPSFNDPWEVLEAGERFKAARGQEFIPEAMGGAAFRDDPQT